MDKDDELKYLAFVLRRVGLNAWKTKDMIIITDEDKLYILNFGLPREVSIYNMYFDKGKNILTKARFKDYKGTLNDFLVRLVYGKKMSNM